MPTKSRWPKRSKDAASCSALATWQNSAVGAKFLVLRIRLFVRDGNVTHQVTHVALEPEARRQPGFVVDLRPGVAEQRPFFETHALGDYFGFDPGEHLVLLVYPKLHLVRCVFARKLLERVRRIFWRCREDQVLA